MTSLHIKTNGADITAIADGKLTSGMVGVPVYIEYDVAWDGLKKTAFFRIGGFVRKRENVTNSTIVPWEVMRYSGKPLEVGLEGRDSDGNIVMPTVWKPVAFVYYGASGDIPAAPNPDSGGGSGGGGGYSGGDLDLEGNDIVNAENIHATAVWVDGVRVQDENGDNGSCINWGENENGCAVLEFYGALGDESTVLRNIAPGTYTGDAVNKGQLDAAVGDIETALDSILAIQNTLIGGDEA